MKKVLIKMSSFGLTLVLGLIFALQALAYQIQDLTNVEVANDFALGPGKTEIWMEPGEKTTKELLITNRLGKTMDFKISIEDVKGSENPEETIILLGQEKGPYSLKDFLKPEITEFTLSHGQRMVLPVEISIPADAEPGGRYGVVLVSNNLPATASESEKDKVKGQMKIVSRLGTIFFIRVKGPVTENGSLQEMKLTRPARFFYEKGPISLSLLFKNEGNVHLTPYGVIEIKNKLGKKIDEIKVDPYFAMPDSVRLREVKWKREWLFGQYTATASINRGYQDIIDQKTVQFWVIPWKIILAGMAVLFILVSFFKWLFSKFEIRRKGSLVAP